MRKPRPPVEKEVLASVLRHLRREQFPRLQRSPWTARDRGWTDSLCEVFRNKQKRMWDCVAERLPELVRLAEVPSEAHRSFCLAIQRLVWSEVGRLERREFYESHYDEALLEAERCL